MIRTRKFEVRNERIETGVLVKSRNGKKVSVERTTGECCRWKAKRQCSKGDSCSFRHEDNQRGRKHNRPLLRSKTKNDGRRLSKGSATKESIQTLDDEEDLRKETLPGESVHQKERSNIVQKLHQKEIVRIRDVIIGVHPYVKISKLNRNANSARSAKG